MAADPRDWVLLRAVQDALRVINGEDDYHYDVSTQVASGLYPSHQPPFQRLPCIAVGYVDVVMEDGPDLAGTLDIVSISIQGWAPQAKDTADERMYAASKLASDIRTALRAARANGSDSALYGAHNFRLGATPADARQLGVALSCGLVVADLTFEYPVDAGQSE